MPTPKSTLISTSTPAQPTAGHDQQDTSKINTVPTGAGVNTGAGITRPKTKEELEADRKYEEAMEEEYAKREGGA